MKHAKEKTKRAYTIYIDIDIIKYLDENIKGVTNSQFINDILFKEISFLKAMDELYTREVSASENA